MADFPITHGTGVTFKKSSFQAHAAAIQSTEELQAVLAQLRDAVRWSSCDAMPFAYRIQSYGEDSDNKLEQGCEDGKELGAGDKLLHLLTKWDIQNVVLIVTRQDTGVPGRLGQQRFRVLLDRAKAVLEQCYLDALNASDDLTDGMAAAAHDDGSAIDMDQHQHQHQHDSAAAQPPQFECDRDGVPRRSADQRGHWSCSVKPGQQLPMGRCQLNSETVPWPRGHKPTPNGGHVGEKQGRISSYLAAPEAEAQQAAAGEREEWTTSQVDRIVRNQTAKYPSSSSPTHTTHHHASSSSAAAAYEYEYAAMAGHEFADDELVQSIDVLSLYGVLQPPNVTQATIIELKSMREPPAKVQQVLHCVAVLLGERHDTWFECRDMVSSDDFRAKLLMLDIGRLRARQVQVVKRMMTAEASEFVPELMAKVSPVAAELLRWVTKAVQIFDLVQASSASGTAAGTSAAAETSSPSLFHDDDEPQIDPSMTVTHQNFGFMHT